MGYRSVVSVRLASRDRKFGSLNAYSANVDDFTPSGVEAMRYLGAHASAAIAASLTVQDLMAALDSRNLIGQAQGVLMSAYHPDADAAFQYLRRLSQDGNITLREVADSVIAQRADLLDHGEASQL